MEKNISGGFSFSAPRVVNFVGQPKKLQTEKFLTNEEQVREFTTGDLFQNFCNHPDNGIRTGMIMTVAVGPSAYSYPAVGGDKVDGLMIFTDRLSGWEYHQRKTKIDRKKERYGQTIFYSESFYVTIKNNHWLALPLIANEGWRKQNEANDALLKWAKLTRCTVIGKTKLLIGTLTHKGEEVCTSEMWALEVISERGRRKNLALMFENGRMVAGDAAELRLSPKIVWEGAVLRTRYNWYRKLGDEFKFI